LEKHIKISKLDGFIFTCPKCEKLIVKSLNKEQINQLAGAHYISCKGVKP